MKEIILQHAVRYPLMQPIDFIKLAFQSAMGCGHLLKDASAVQARLHAERDGIHNGVFLEEIGNGLCRLHLNRSGTPVSDEAITRAFFATANTFLPDEKTLTENLSLLLALSKEEKLPVSADAMFNSVSEYRKNGMGLVSHSEIFRTAYHPAYRVVLKSLAEEIVQQKQL